MQAGAQEEIEKELVRSLEAIVLDDQKISLAEAAKNVIYFENFLGTAKKELIESTILPRMQYICNRKKGFVGINAKLISYMRNYWIESED